MRILCAVPGVNCLKLIKSQANNKKCDNSRLFHTDERGPRVTADNVDRVPFVVTLSCSANFINIVLSYNTRTCWTTWTATRSSRPVLLCIKYGCLVYPRTLLQSNRGDPQLVLKYTMSVFVATYDTKATAPFLPAGRSVVMKKRASFGQTGNWSVIHAKSKKKKKIQKKKKNKECLARNSSVILQICSFLLLFMILLCFEASFCVLFTQT